MSISHTHVSGEARGPFNVQVELAWCFHMVLNFLLFDSPSSVAVLHLEMYAADEKMRISFSDLSTADAGAIVGCRLQRKSL